MAKGIYKHSKLTEIHKSNISKATVGKNNPFYGKKHSSETREKMKLAWDKRKKAKEFWIRKKKQNQLHSINMKNLWANKDSVYNSIEYRQTLSKTHVHSSIYFNRKINKKEQFLYDILLSMRDNEFIYVGDNPVLYYTFKKYPDFVDFNNKKIIELFGDYWHSEKKTGHNKETEEKLKKDYFKTLGYKTLIIWEHELKDSNEIKSKVKNYINMEVK